MITKTPHDSGEVFSELADSLGHFAAIALPSRLDRKTRGAVEDLCTHSVDTGPASVATGAIYGLAIRGGTIEFPGFHAGS